MKRRGCTRSEGEKEKRKRREKRGGNVNGRKSRYMKLS